VGFQAVGYALAMTRNIQYAGVFALLMAAILPAISQAQEFDRYGHALIQDKQGWVYVDRDQLPVLRPYIFDNGPDYYEEGLARFVDNGKMGFHNEALHVVIPAVYDFVFPFENGTAQAGTNCTFHRAAEHSSVSCQQWKTVRNPMRRAGAR